MDWTLNIIQNIDVRLMYLINVVLSNRITDVSMPSITNYGAYFFLIWVAYLYYKKERNFYFLFLVAFSFVCGDFLSNIIKELVARVRPCHVHDFVRNLVGCRPSFSFPSNHAMNSFATACFIFMASGKKYRAVFLPALIIAISRIFIGVHYPFDVLAGAAFGVILGYVIYRMYDSLVVKLSKEQPYYVFLVFFLLAISGMRVLYVKYGPLDLSGDEAHYWEWSRNLDLSYYSKGPLIAFIIAAGNKLMGATSLGVRFFAILFSNASSILIYATAYKITGDDKKSFMPAFLLQTVPFFAPLGMLMTIDSPLIFFWVLGLFVMTRLMNKDSYNSNWNWIFLGAVIGAGMLAKYTMVFFYAGIFMYFVMERRTQELITGRGLYCAILTTFIFFLPVIVWNYEFGWVTLRHTAGHARIAQGFTISFKSFGEFLASQFGLITPVLFVVSFFLVRFEKGAVKSFLLSFFLPVFVFFLLKSIQGRVEANWPLAAYPAAFIGIGVLSNRHMYDRVIMAGIILAVTVTIAAHVIPYYSLPVKYNPVQRLIGWKDAAKMIDEEKLGMPAPGDIFFFSDEYQFSSLLSFYMAGNPFVYCPNFGRRMNQYDIWAMKDGRDINSMKGKDALFASRRYFPDHEARLKEGFNRYEKIEKIVYNKNVFLRKIYIYRCFGFKGFKEELPRSY